MKRQGSWLGMALVAVMLGCAPRAPQKPAGLPEESFWVGTRQSGVFVLIGPKDREGWKVKIFNDHSGAIQAEGLFTLRGMARAEITREDLLSYDGNALHLADGALLAPKVKP